MDQLIKGKLVLMLKDDVKVQALEWLVERKMIKIKFEGSKDSFLVNNGALKIKHNDKTGKNKDTNDALVSHKSGQTGIAP